MPWAGWYANDYQRPTRPAVGAGKGRGVTKPRLGKRKRR